MTNHMDNGGHPPVHEQRTARHRQYVRSLLELLATQQRFQK
jgi:hypothetical protein